MLADSNIKTKTNSKKISGLVPNKNTQSVPFTLKKNFLSPTAIGASGFEKYAKQNFLKQPTTAQPHHTGVKGSELTPPSKGPHGKKFFNKFTSTVPNYSNSGLANLNRENLLV